MTYQIYHTQYASSYLNMFLIIYAVVILSRETTLTSSENILDDKTIYVGVQLRTFK